MARPGHASLGFAAELPQLGTRDFRRHLILIAMFGDHRLAWKWLMTPTDKLGGNSPIDTLLTGTLADVVAAARLAVEHAPDV
ncbi:MAG: DUF2384 domain-containing protein [Mesorhizobium sp.]|nr:MAG: DUF2384 domain-containing protein [Mesorhizobium sp.]